MSAGPYSMRALKLAGPPETEVRVRRFTSHQPLVKGSLTLLLLDLASKDMAPVLRLLAEAKTILASGEGPAEAAR